MLSELLPEVKKQLHELEQQYLLLEKNAAVRNPALQNGTDTDMYMKLNEMNFRLDELDKLVLREPKAKRDDCRRKVQHIRSSYHHLKFSMENRLKMKDRVSFDSQRKELFQGTSLVSRDISLDLAESGSLDRSGQKLSKYIAVGQESLNELFSQRDRLKGVQRKVFDILNYLGLSNRIMKMAEQRDTIDKWIVFVGMFLICALIFGLWYFYRRK